MSKTLLLVEDSFTIQKVVQTTFTTAGYQVVVANDAREGLAALSTISPDVILADALMPGMDGFQLCQAIRVTEGLDRTPVILLTSRFMSVDEDLGKRVGVTAYLAKPFDSFTLLSLVQQLINGTPSVPQFSPLAVETPIAPGMSPAELLPDSASTQPTIPPHTAPSSHDGPAPPVAVDQLVQGLGQNLVHIVEEAVQTHLVTLLDALTPHLVDEIRGTVEAKVPELLELLLQREIDKLKQAASQDE